MQKFTRFLLTFLAALAIPEIALGSVNDAFANGRDLGSVSNAVISYDSRDATRQVGEPTHASNSSTGSLWWRWTAPANGNLWVQLAVNGVNNSGVRAVYTGSVLTTLNRVGETSFNAILPVSVTAGVTYHIAVADNRAASLVIDFYPLPTNDAFENRSNLANPSNFTIDATTVGATLQSGEPGGTNQGPTLWWSWQAPADGIVTYNVTGSDGSNWNVNAFTGGAFASLWKRSERTSGQSADALTALRVKAGEVFSIQVSRMSSNDTGRVRVNWQLAPQPYQATSADAFNLGSISSASGNVDNRNAITPTTPSVAKLWWRWTAPSNGIFRWTVARTDGGLSPTTAVLDANLLQLSPNTTLSAYYCRSGQVYLLSAETSASNAGKFDYRFTFESAAANDSLANASTLAMGETLFDSTYASVESGEPVISNFSWNGSLWWLWTAPSDGAFWLDVERDSSILAAWGLNPVQTVIKNDSFLKKMMISSTAGSSWRIGMLETSLSTKPGA